MMNRQNLEDSIKNTSSYIHQLNITKLKLRVRYLNFELTLKLPIFNHFLKT